jgi:hypothetical protein
VSDIAAPKGLIHCAIQVRFRQPAPSWKRMTVPPFASSKFARQPYFMENG